MTAHTAIREILIVDKSPGNSRDLSTARTNLESWLTLSWTRHVLLGLNKFSNFRCSSASDGNRNCLRPNYPRWRNCPKSEVSQFSRNRKLPFYLIITKKVGLDGLLVDQELVDRVIIIAIVDHSNQCYNSSIPSLAPALFHPSASSGAPH